MTVMERQATTRTERRIIRTPQPEQQWYTTQEVIDTTGISFRVLDYWLRTRAIVLSRHKNNPGSGNGRRYTAAEVEAIARLVERYRAATEELEAIRSGKAWAESAA